MLTSTNIHLHTHYRLVPLHLSHTPSHVYGGLTCSIHPGIGPYWIDFEFMQMEDDLIISWAKNHIYKFLFMHDMRPRRHYITGLNKESAYEIPSFPLTHIHKPIWAQHCLLLGGSKTILKSFFSHLFLNKLVEVCLLFNWWWLISFSFSLSHLIQSRGWLAFAWQLIIFTHTQATMMMIMMMIDQGSLCDHYYQYLAHTIHHHLAKECVCE